MIRSETDNEFDEKAYREQIQVTKLIKESNFDHPQVKKNKRIIIDVVKNLDVTQQSIQLLINLFMKYKLKVLIAFKPFCEKLKKTEDLSEQVILKWDELVQTIWEKKIICWPSVQMNYIRNFFSFFEFQKHKLKPKQQNKKNKEEEKFEKKRFPQFIVKLQTYYEQHLKEKKYLNFETIQRKFMQFEKSSRDNNCPFQQLCLKQLQNKILFQESDQSQNKCTQLCCRNQFQDQEVVGNETEIFQFKTFFPPFKIKKIWALKKTICSFLNAGGGFIFLGIKDENGVGKVQGISHLLQEKIIEVIKSYVMKFIFPSPFHLVEFHSIPIYQTKNQENQLTGQFILRVKVNPNNYVTMNYFEHQEKHYFADRIDDAIICYNFISQKEKIERRQKKKSQQKERRQFHKQCINHTYPNKSSLNSQIHEALICCFQSNEEDKAVKQYILFQNINFEEEKYRFLRQRISEHGKLVKIQNSYYAIILQNKYQYQLFLKMIQRQQGEEFVSEKIVNLGSSKLRAYFDEQLADLAQMFLKKSLSLQIITTQKANQQSERDNSNEKGYYFIFQNHNDEYFCLKAYVAVEILKQKMKKFSRIHIMPV